MSALEKNSRGTFIRAVCLTALSAASPAFAGTATTPPRGASTHVTLRYSVGGGDRVMARSVTVRNGKAVYEVVLVPEIDAEKNVVEVRLALTPRGEDVNSVAAVFWAYPPGFTGVHGFQPWFFAAADFARGIGKSMYGKTRTVRVKYRSIVVQIVVLEAKVQRIRRSDVYRFDSLEVQVKVVNAT